jgi:hypothetical protein
MRRILLQESYVILSRSNGPWAAYSTFQRQIPLFLYCRSAFYTFFFLAHVTASVETNFIANAPGFC